MDGIYVYVAMWWRMTGFHVSGLGGQGKKGPGRFGMTVSVCNRILGSLIKGGEGREMRRMLGYWQVLASRSEVKRRSLVETSVRKLRTPG